MSIHPNITVALRALKRNTLQTSLTILGMTIGVAAVLTMIALGTGAEAAIEDQVRAAGMNLIMVTAGNYNVDACTQASGQSPFAVAASTRTDAKADFSNWGTCVKIYAPGVDIKTTWPPALPSTSFVRQAVRIRNRRALAALPSAPASLLMNFGISA